jgi:hypothetical protein
VGRDPRPFEDLGPQPLPRFKPESEQPGGVMVLLEENSFCKDAGKQLNVYAPVAGKPPRFRGPFIPWCADILGGPRIMGNRPDIGAYEIPGPEYEGFIYCTYGE